jgi:hypothetical protein
MSLYRVKDRGGLKPHEPPKRPMGVDAAQLQVYKENWKYYVDCLEFASRFRDESEVHELSDTDVVNLIIRYGRACILVGDDGIRLLHFQTNYD